MRMILPLLLAAAAPGAMAALSFEAQFTNLRYELTDLDPSDGMTPFVTPIGLDWGGAIARLNKRRNGDFLSIKFGTQIGQLNSQGGSAYAEVSWTPDNFAMIARGTAVAPHAGLEANTWAWLDSEVSGNTRLTVRMDYSVNIHVDKVAGAPEGDFVYLDMDGSGMDRPISKIIRSNPALDPNSGDFQAQGHVNFVYENHFNSSQPFSHSMHIIGRARPQALMVPEPATPAMMLAGLGMVGWLARHRKSNKA